eukprot:TRINITY_DN3292_c0_g2_i5.p1 TRINITY_DN3292_c0_g2~~TRINITY_DN3292_c0_g2_i5.p1  ORF type:complete len:850 (+),score=165.27 TRINITY_DN3292_c0_g2_i5:59-2608(+)
MRRGTRSRSISGEEQADIAAEIIVLDESRVSQSSSQEPTVNQKTTRNRRSSLDVDPLLTISEEKKSKRLRKRPHPKGKKSTDDDYNDSDEDEEDEEDEEEYQNEDHEEDQDHDEEEDDDGDDDDEARGGSKAKGKKSLQQKPRKSMKKSSPPKAKEVTKLSSETNQSDKDPFSILCCELEKKYAQEDGICFVSRDGAQEGDILVGTILNNRFLQIMVMEGKVKPMLRKSLFLKGLRVAISKILATDENLDSKWTILLNLCGPHMDWPYTAEDKKSFLYAMTFILQSCFPDILSTLSPKTRDIIPNVSTVTCLQEAKGSWERMGWDYQHLTLPAHTPLTDILVDIIDPGQGTHAPIFEILMEKALEHRRETGKNMYFAYKDIGLEIAKHTGDPNVTYFMNYSVMKHLDERPYEPQYPRSQAAYKTEDDGIEEIDNIDNAERIQESTPLQYPKSERYVRLSMSKDGTPTVCWDQKPIMPLNSGVEYQDCFYEFEGCAGICFMYDGPTPLGDPSRRPREKKVLAHGLLKSLIQKATRRGKSQDALCAFEALMNSPPSFNPTLQRGMRALPESLLRLVIIAVEDVGVCLDLAAVAWMAYVSFHSTKWYPSDVDLRFLRRFVYSMAETSQRCFFSPSDHHGRSDPGPIRDLHRWPPSQHKAWDLPSSHLALAALLELRTACPGMEGDKVMLRCARDLITRQTPQPKGAKIRSDISSGKSDSTKTLAPNFVGEEADLPREIIEADIPWSLEAALRTPQCVDFHSSPMIVDLIMDADPEAYTYYAAKSAAQTRSSKKGTATTHKTAAAAALKKDMWDYSSCFNIRDARAIVCDEFWNKKVQAHYLILADRLLRGHR